MRIRLAGHRIRDDLSLVHAVAAEIGVQFAGGRLAELVDVRVTVEGRETAMVVRPRPGVAMGLSLSRAARADGQPDTFEELGRAVRSGERFEVGDVDYRLEADGHVIIDVKAGRLVFAPVERELDLTLSFRGRGLPEQRVIAPMILRPSPASADMAPRGRTGAIGIAASIDRPGRRLTVRITLDESRAVDLGDQLACVRLSRRLHAGGSCEIWVGTDRLTRARFGAMPQFPDSAASERALGDLAALTALLGAPGTPVRRLTVEDQRQVAFALRLARVGRARFGGSGTWSFTIDRDLSPVLVPDGSGRIGSLRMDPPSWPVPLSDREFDLGPVTFLVERALPARVERGPRGFKHIIPFDDDSLVELVRPQLADPTTAP